MFDHIIFLSLDTLRSDGISSNPYKLWPEKYNLPPTLRTPLLDEIAANGAFFSNCISAAPYTSASHATFFTGKWPPRHGIYEFFNRALRTETVFAAASRARFNTTFKVDFPIILGQFLGFDRGIDRYIIEDDDAFLQAISSQKRNFALAHFGGLHAPYGFHNLRSGGKTYIDTVQRLEAEIPPSRSNPADTLVETYRDSEDLDLMVRYKRIVQHHYEQQNYSKLFQLYLEGIEYFLETRFTPFFRKLTTILSGSRYLIILFGDHGEEFDEGSYGHHNSMAEGVLRVPVVFYGTGIKPGQYHRRIRSIDIVPTLLDLLGSKGMVRSKMDGSSLAETVAGGAEYPVRPAFAQTFVADTSKFIEYQKKLLARGSKSGSLPHFLYKEAVYMNNLKLVRQHYQFEEAGGIAGLAKCPEKITVDEIDERNRLSSSTAKDLVPSLLVQLDEYNKLRCRPQTRSLAVPNQIREQLQNMGYQV
jgi:choline-sulfatase